MNETCSKVLKLQSPKVPKFQSVRLWDFGTFDNGYNGGCNHIFITFHVDFIYGFVENFETFWEAHETSQS